LGGVGQFMEARHKQVTIKIEESLANAIVQLAKREKKFASKIMAQLMAEALDEREDKHFSKISDAVNVESVPLVSHENAWK